MIIEYNILHIRISGGHAIGGNDSRWIDQIRARAQPERVSAQVSGSRRACRINRKRHGLRRAGWKHRRVYLRRHHEGGEGYCYEGDGLEHIQPYRAQLFELFRFVSDCPSFGTFRRRRINAARPTPKSNSELGSGVAAALQTAQGGIFGPVACTIVGIMKAEKAIATKAMDLNIFNLDECFELLA